MPGQSDDLFRDARGRPRVLRGVAIHSGSPRFAELAGMVGFEAVWIEMEHGSIGFDQAEAVCMAAQGAGAAPMIRVPDGQRTHVLRALEVGARAVIVPMVNDAGQARAVVEAGKYPPLGKRGYNTRSRAVGYGLLKPVESFERANARTHLFVQIETLESIANLDAIMAVEGLSGIFIGPGDLSASMGLTGELNHPEVVRVVVDATSRARARGLHAGILVGPGKLLDAALSAGADLIFAGGDLNELTAGWPKLLASLPFRAP